MFRNVLRIGTSKPVINITYIIVFFFLFFFIYCKKLLGRGKEGGQYEYLWKISELCLDFLVIFRTKNLLETLIFSLGAKKA